MDPAAGKELDLRNKIPTWAKLWAFMAWDMVSISSGRFLDRPARGIP